ARAATSGHREGAAARASDAAVKTAIPSDISRRRPNRSPSRPADTTRVVTASRYASTTHCTDWKEASNARTKVGSPTLAMLVPSEDSSMVRARQASAPDRTGAADGGDGGAFMARKPAPRAGEAEDA